VRSSLAAANDRPVLVALTNSRWETLQILLDAGADPNVVDWLGNPALKLLAERKAHEDSLDGPVLAAARLLFDKRANPSMPGESRYTALHAATARNFRSMASLLLERGADVNAEAEENGLAGLKPLQIAEDQKYTAMAELLRSKGGTTSVAFSAQRAARRTATTILAPILRGH
jgi:ankyrin repeat protein